MSASELGGPAPASASGRNPTSASWGSGAGLDEEADLLRFSTAGSVDDGKSTLIGRLLYDTKTAFEDQLQHVEDVSRRRGDERVNLALLTDGLRAEREQGITIDVAYRYFATKRRKFIIADTPGHIQYTRNMVTGASTAGLSIILVDARQGLVEQSRRHAFIASLLRIPHLVFAVNKMDLVDWSEDRFRMIEDEFRNFAARLDVQDIAFIPVSALTGANVVERSVEMPWYHGPTLLYHLETVHIASDRNLIDVRFPVQWVIRPQSAEHPDYRGYAGQVAGGVLRVGDEVVALPSGLATRITRIEQLGAPVEAAFAPMSVTIHLADDVDVGRGDLLCRPNNQPTVGQDLDAMICWMVDKPLAVKGRYALKHTTRWTRAMITDVLYRLDVNTGHRDEAIHELKLNDLGRIRLRTTTPILYDPYRRNRTTGSFILVDEVTNNTVAAGMLLAPE
ncbi:MAG TPA: GTP-binding protein [Kofleriaceae bacterium]|jgi:sulfate adenylyltransferase large subunit|nr:GTP-binding protein [Kofleriaceae bacterium]